MYKLWTTMVRLNIMDIVSNGIAVCFAQKPIKSTTYEHSRLRSCPHRPKVLVGWLRGLATPPFALRGGAAAVAT